MNWFDGIVVVKKGVAMIAFLFLSVWLAHLAGPVTYVQGLLTEIFVIPGFVFAV